MNKKDVYRQCNNLCKRCKKECVGIKFCESWQKIREQIKQNEQLVANDNAVERFWNLK